MSPGVFSLLSAVPLSVRVTADSGAPALHLARIGGEEIAVIAIVFGVGGAVIFPLVRAFARRLEGPGPSSGAMSPEVAARLDRIERGIEAIAVEVERISEGQRFVTKVMADRPEGGRLPPAPR